TALRRIFRQPGLQECLHPKLRTEYPISAEQFNRVPSRVCGEFEPQAADHPGHQPATSVASRAGSESNRSDYVEALLLAITAVCDHQRDREHRHRRLPLATGEPANKFLAWADVPAILCLRTLHR